MPIFSDFQDLVKGRGNGGGGLPYPPPSAIPHTAIGGTPVAARVSRLDDSVLRNTRAVSLLVRREPPHG